MRWILVPILWVVAIVAAFIILRRVRRGKHVVLRGRFSPRLIRMIVVVLVILGVNSEKESNSVGAPITTSKEDPYNQLPSTITLNAIRGWLLNHEPNGYAHQYKKDYTLLKLEKNPKPDQIKKIVQHARHMYEPINKMILSEMEYLSVGKPVPPVSLTDLIVGCKTMDTYGAFDHWTISYLWRKTNQDFKPEEGKQLIEFYTRLHQAARITDSLIRAQGQVRPMMQPPRAWASKAGPRPADLPILKAYEASLQDMLVETKKAYPKTDAGSWQRDAGVWLIIGKEPASLEWLSAGNRKLLKGGEEIRFSRLDLLQTGKGQNVLEVEGLGNIEVPESRLLTVWQFPNLLSKEAQAKVRETVKKALEGKESSAEELEKRLPFTHAAIREGLKESPSTKGASRLRMILSTFDDTVMPVLPDQEPTKR
jgi:hypothetical protein